MSRLSDLVNDALVRNTHADGTIDTGAAVSAIKPTIGPDETDILVTEALVHRVKNAAKISRAGMLANAKKRNLQLPFEGLHVAYPLDLDGRYIKQTESLTRAEFQRVISIREKQIVDDTAHLTKLRSAFDALAPFWDAQPDWTVMQCVAALLGKDAA